MYSSITLAAAEVYGGPDDFLCATASGQGQSPTAARGDLVDGPSGGTGLPVWRHGGGLFAHRRVLHETTASGHFYCAR
jgi:hypothetical protein